MRYKGVRKKSLVPVVLKVREGPITLLRQKRFDISCCYIMVTLKILNTMIDVAIVYFSKLHLSSQTVNVMVSL